MNRSPIARKDTLRATRFFGSEEAPLAITIPAEREDVNVPYNFTPEELSEMGHTHRKTLDAIETLKTQMKTSAQDFKLRISTKENEEKQLRMKLASGEETRPMRVAVAFDAKRGMKRYLYPDTGDFIREEPMQAADWQLPLIREELDKQRKPAPEVPGYSVSTQEAAASAAAGVAASVDNRPAGAEGSPIGETNMGDKLGAAAARTVAAQFVLDLDAPGGFTDKGLISAFAKAAKLAGWTPIQISTLKEVLRGAESVPAMIATLRPYTVGSAPTPPAVPSGPSEEQAQAAGKVAQCKVAGIMLDRVVLTMEDGWPASKYRQLFRNAARVAVWPEAIMDQVDEEALAIESSIVDEPEAGQKVREYLRPFTAELR